MLAELAPPVFVQGTSSTATPSSIARACASIPAPRPWSPCCATVRVTDEGKPLAGATIKLADLGHDTVVATQVTDAAGRARFVMPGRGAWRLAVVWTKPLPTAAETDFETVFSSLTFAGR